MRQSIGQVALVVREYDEAIDFYVRKLGFTLIEDTYIPEQNKRWIIVALPGSTESRLLLARAVGEKQSSCIGNESGGRVFLFLFTDDFWRDFHSYKAKGVGFVHEPQEMSYGTVAVLKTYTATFGIFCNANHEEDWPGHPGYRRRRIRHDHGAAGVGKSTLLGIICVQLLAKVNLNQRPRLKENPATLLRPSPIL